MEYVIAATLMALLLRAVARAHAHRHSQPVAIARPRPAAQRTGRE